MCTLQNRSRKLAFFALRERFYFHDVNALRGAAAWEWSKGGGTGHGGGEEKRGDERKRKVRVFRL